VGIRLGAGEVEDGFDEVFGLRAGNEDVRGDAEAKAEELLRTGEVLERMLHGAARGQGAKGVEVARGEVVVGVGEEPGAVAMEDVGEQGLGIATGDGSGSFEERVAECHCLRARIKLADAAERRVVLSDGRGVAVLAERVRGFVG